MSPVIRQSGFDHAIKLGTLYAISQPEERELTDVQQYPAYQPTDEDRASVLAWFEQYDALAQARDFAAMADMAVFPLNEVTDDGNGNASATQLDRAAYVAQMAEVMGDGEYSMESTRTPHFLSDALVFVITDAVLDSRGSQAATAVRRPADQGRRRLEVPDHGPGRLGLTRRPGGSIGLSLRSTGSWSVEEGRHVRGESLRRV